MPPSTRPDSLRLALRVGVYVLLFVITAFFSGPLLLWAGGYLAGLTAANLVSAIFANWLALRIWENRRIFELGLWWNRASSANLTIGFLGGAGAGCLVLGPPLASGLARLVRTPDVQPAWGPVIFVIVMIAAGAVGEELLFRGYGFQALLASLGPSATILPVGIVFGLMHSDNPNSTPLGLVNTAAFGILFGYAYLRSRDLWLPIGLHLGWNFCLPLFGVNLSGLKMNVTGYEMSWTAGSLWSGGEYGPEASILTSVVVLLLAVYLWKAPIRRQPSPLTDPPEGPECEPSAPLPS